MNSFPFDIVGFDLDGTLLDTSGDLGAALNHTLAVAGRPTVPAEQVRDLIGGGSRVMLERALTLTGGYEDDELRHLSQILLTHYEANISAHSRLFAGGEAMLDGLAARGVQVAVVTNKLERFAVKLLDELGLSARFCTILGGDTLGPGRNKPAPDLLHEMLARSGASRPAFVGDTTYDTRAAAAAGMPCVAVSFGFCDRAPHDLGATTVIDHFDALITALEMLEVPAV